MVHSTALRYFAEVARTGSLAAASENLHVAVSAVSRQISRLESQIGASLFDRVPRGMVLTKPGEVLAEHARRTLLEANAVLAEISTAHGRVRSVVRIGCDEPFTISFLPTVMAAFHRKHPCARFVVRSSVPEVVEQWVEAGEVDVGLSFSASSAAAVSALCSVRVPAEALCRDGHPLACKPCLGIEDLLAYPLAVPERDATLRRLFDSRCAAEGRHFEPLLITDSAALVHEFVSLTDGIAVGSGVLLHGLHSREGLVGRRINEPLLNERRLRVITMEGRRLPATVSQFLDTLKNALLQAV
jgi:DNA-binding transcriptional LysR family regulator